MTSVKITAETLNAALNSPQVRVALQRKADRVKSRAKSVAYSAGATEFAEAVETRAETRPGSKSALGLKRPTVKVLVEVTDEMRRKDQQSKLSRRKILRQASRA